MGVHVLVLREMTERMEAVEAGVAHFGTDPAVIVAAADEALAANEAGRTRQCALEPSGMVSPHNEPWVP